MPIKKNSIAVPAMPAKRDGVTVSASKEIKSYDDFAFGGGAESTSIMDGEHIALLPDPANAYFGESSKKNVLKVTTTGRNNRKYENQLFNVISYRLDDQGNQVNIHNKWWNPASLLQRDFPVTAQPEGDSTIVKQTGLRSRLISNDFNDEHKGWSLVDLVKKMIEGNLGVTAEDTGTVKTWFGRWENGQRVEDTYEYRSYNAVRFEDVPDDLFED